MEVRQISPINEIFDPGQAIGFFGPDGRRAVVYMDSATMIQSNNPIFADAHGRVHRVYVDRDDIQWLPLVQ